MKANNPFLILGVPPSAGDDTIRAAYLEKLRQFPPDRDPERFKEISDAYNRIQNYRERFKVWYPEKKSIIESSVFEGLPEVMKYMSPPKPLDFKELQNFLKTA